MPVITLKDYPGAMTYTWWCPKCQVDHYTPYCPMGEHERLAKSWEDSRNYEFYEFCPHCGQIKEIT